MMLVEDKLTVVVETPVETQEPAQVEQQLPPEGEEGEQLQKQESVHWAAEQPPPPEVEILPLKDYTL